MNGQREPTNELSFREVRIQADLEAAVLFLRRHEWPFHASAQGPDLQTLQQDLRDKATRCFWLLVEGRHVGLLRVLDLDDIGDGCPVFDIRIEPQSHGRGLGRRAVQWMSHLLFNEYTGLHRIEATTRADHAAMRRVLEFCGFKLEGMLRETWITADGTWKDTAVYGLLRRELEEAETSCWT
jgi:RimJ/RimL family protein N-acetyltransferase